MSERPVRMAVVGVGYLGRFHAQKVAANPEAQLVAVVDADADRARQVADEVGCQALTSHAELLGQVDAVSVVTPTEHHFAVARDFLAAGADVLCEKPITASVAEADQLIELARAQGRLLQVGHLERFNPAVGEVMARVTKPQFIECNRIAPFKARATDVDVALDLMIHDLDIILAMVGESPSDVRAVGVPVLGSRADLVNARLEFPSGCVANITASRLALKDERKMRIFQPEAYLALDFKERRLQVISGVKYRPGEDPQVDMEAFAFDSSDPLAEEVGAFVASVKSRQEPAVDGEAARKALACALEVSTCVTQGLCGREDLLEAPRRWVDAVIPGQD